MHYLLDSNTFITFHQVILALVGKALSIHLGCKQEIDIVSYEHSFCPVFLLKFGFLDSVSVKMGVLACI